MAMNPIATASARLAGDWSAPDFARQLTPQALAELTARFDGLDPLVRVRLLLAALHLPAEARAGMAAELQDLAAAAAADKEEWVATMGAAIGDFDGHLDLDAAERASAPLRGTLNALTAAAAAHGAPPPDGFRPLEEAYLTRRLQDAARGGGGGGAGTLSATQEQAHFKVRPGGVPAPGGLAAAAAAAAATAAAAAAGSGPVPGLGLPALSPPPAAAPTTGPGGGGLLSPPAGIGAAAGGLAAASRRAAGLASTSNLQQAGGGGGGGGGGRGGGPQPAAPVPPPPPAARTAAGGAAASMFRSSRPTLPGGRGGGLVAGGGGAATAAPRGAAREVKAKVLDVADALAIAARARADAGGGGGPQDTAPAAAAQQPPPPPPQPTAGGGDDSEREEGEVEEGELPDDGGDDAPDAKRARGDDNGNDRPRWMDYDAPAPMGGGGALQWD